MIKAKLTVQENFLYSARIIPYRGSWLDVEFDPKDLVFVRIDRRRKLPASILLKALDYSAQDILEMFYENNKYFIGKDGALSIELVPSRLRGVVLNFDVKNKRTVIVPASARITARHIREIEKANLTKLDVPSEFILGNALAADVIDTDTGEVLVACNTEVTEEVLEILVNAGVKEFETIYTNDLDCGPFISDTLRSDSTTNRLEALVEIYRMMRPGEPPTKESAENLVC